MVSPTQESCLIGRLRVGLLRGEGELSDAEKKGLRRLGSIPTGLCASGRSEGDGKCGQEVDGDTRGETKGNRKEGKDGTHPDTQQRREKERLFLSI